MALIYTGRADTLVVDGKTYRHGDRVQISKARAAQLAASSRLHSFEDDEGHDVLEAATTPAPAVEAPKKA